MTSEWQGKLRQIDEHRWEIPRDYKPGMRVPGVVFSDERMMRDIRRDQSLEQVANVATLPGIVVASLAMPDIHWGYGFPIGGVAAMRASDGVISPGGVGFDINCGVRMLRTDLSEEEARPVLEELTLELFRNVPSGVGSSGKIHLRGNESDQVMRQGARWAVDHGYGDADDVLATEGGGCLPGADPSTVGPKPRERGGGQLGTLGSGNHFLEVQVVDEIFDHVTAAAFGIHDVGQVTVMIHCGSRGFGHQVCEDYLKVMDQAMRRYGISVPDRQLACAPLSSPEGRDYLSAMACAGNYAWANRQCIAHFVRESFQNVFKRSWRSMGIRQVYDVCHNVAKMERHVVEGRETEVCVHRKGATRAFPPGHPDVPEQYRDVGQPVMIPGDMGRYSFLCAGVPEAMERSFGSTCHGAGRRQSRHAAKKAMRGVDIAKELAKKGIVVKAASWSGLAEEVSEAYKDVADVVEVAHAAGLSKRVCRLRPMGVVKG